MTPLDWASYWTTTPSTEKTDSSSLWSRAQRYLDATEHTASDPLEYVEQLCNQWIIKAKTRGWDVILSADLNAGYGINEGTHSNFKPWADQYHLDNKICNLRRLVTKPQTLDSELGTKIYHILTSGPFRLESAKVLQTTRIEALFDHRPVIAAFQYSVQLNRATIKAT